MCKIPSKHRHEQLKFENETNTMKEHVKEISIRGKATHFSVDYRQQRRAETYFLLLATRE